MPSSIKNFIELLEQNIKNHYEIDELIVLYTEEYESLALEIHQELKSIFQCITQKLETIFDPQLENFINKKKYFVLFYTLPWDNLKKYYSHIRPILSRHLNRSFIVRDCLNDFNHIYSESYHIIKQRNDALIQRGNQTNTVRIKNNLGTDLTFSFNQKSSWRSIDGTSIANEIVPAEISNSTPDVNGIAIFTGSIVSLVPIGKKYGLITDPITFEIAQGYIKSVHCTHSILEQDLKSIFNYCEGNSQVIELGIGTNMGIHLIGMSAPFEERKAGFHLGIGGYLPQSQHIDFIFDSSEIYFDDACVFSKNEFHF